MSSTDEDEIIARLRLDAKAGNVQAARELREWLRARRERDEQASSIDTATSYAQLTHAQRGELRARLLGEYLFGEALQRGLDETKDWPVKQQRDLLKREPSASRGDAQASVGQGAQEPVQAPVQAPVEGPGS